MRIGLVKDESGKYDGYDWHSVYADEFLRLGDGVVLLDFKRENWLEQLKKINPDFVMWRAWHVPDDRDDAKNKIQFVERVLNIPIFPTWNMYASYDNKILQNYFLREMGFRIPETKIFRSYSEAVEYVKKAVFPVVSKCSEGACGDNVRLLNSKKELTDHIEKAFSDEGLGTYFPWVKQKGYVYLQEYLPIDRDLRIITIGDKVELAHWRENKANWKKNISAGARINTKGIPEEAKRVSLELTKRLGFHWCALDLAVLSDEVYVLEFSSIFGFSRCGNYEQYFGSPNAFILKKQVEYLHNLFENERRS